MGGLIVTPREEDYRALDAGLIRGIFREVAYDDAAVESLLAPGEESRRPHDRQEESDAS
jgi:hypothetical protein